MVVLLHGGRFAPLLVLTARQPVPLTPNTVVRSRPHIDLEARRWTKINSKHCLISMNCRAETNVGRIAKGFYTDRLSQ